MRAGKFCPVPHNRSVTTQNQDPESAAATNRSSLVNIIGISSGLLGSLFALVALTTPLLKIAGVLACIIVAMVLWQAARDRAHGQLSTALMWQLVTAGVFVLVLVVLLGSQTAPKAGSPGGGGTLAGQPATGAADGDGSVSTAAPLPDRTGTASPDGGTKPAQPGPVWLSDLSPVDAGDGWEPGAAVADTRRFEHSVVVGTCFDSEDHASYQLGRQYGRFVASVGLAEDAPTDARVKLTVLADDRQVASRTVGVGAVVPLDVPVAGAYRLVMKVETVGLSQCDERDLILGDAKLIP